MLCACLAGGSCLHLAQCVGGRSPTRAADASTLGFATVFHIGVASSAVRLVACSLPGGLATCLGLAVASAVVRLVAKLLTLLPIWPAVGALGEDSDRPRGNSSGSQGAVRVGDTGARGARCALSMLSGIDFGLLAASSLRISSVYVANTPSLGWPRISLSISYVPLLPASSTPAMVEITLRLNMAETKPVPVARRFAHCLANHSNSQTMLLHLGAEKLVRARSFSWPLLVVAGLWKRFVPDCVAKGHTPAEGK